MTEELRVGLIGESQGRVTSELTAVYMKSGNLDVFATPAMVAFMESASASAVDSVLAEGLSTVGIEINVRHLSATPIGEKITAIAEVSEINGRRIKFEVRAWDERELIGEGTHTRYIIDVAQFLDRLQGEK